MFPPLIVLLGPTAVGKTELSLSLCEKFKGEVVSADSRQLYRFMDIGTAKATPQEQQRIPHHLLDLCNPDEHLTVAEYQRLAYEAVDAIHARSHLPFLVGGTALYLRAIVEGLRIPEVPPNPQLRNELEEQLASEGVQSLFEQLQQLDPATSAVIDGRNPRRVLRALEIVITTGKSKVELEGAEPPPYRILSIGLTRNREALYRRVDQRVDEMLRQGLVEETRQLLARGYDETLPAMSSLGYRECIAHLHGDLSAEETAAALKIATHRFVRHQYTSFRRMKEVHWFDLDIDRPSQVFDLVAAFLEEASHRS